MTLRAAIIGCGKIASGFADDPLLAGDVFTHAEAYSRSAETELVAVCDRDPAAAARCAERWNVAWHGTAIDALLHEARPEVASVCTPDDTHHDVAAKLMKAPSIRAILCEKPLATRVDEGEALVRFARNEDKLFAVCYMRRYAINLRNLRRFLEEGSIGPVRAVGGWYTKGALHNGSHWFDLVRMLAGEGAWVEGHDRLHEEGDDPTLDVAIGLRSGVVATLRGLDSRNYSLFEMDILTAGGRVSIRDSGHEVRVFRAVPSKRYTGYTELAEEALNFGDRRNLMLHAVEDLVAALAEGRAPLCTGADGLAALRIADAARKSAAEGMRITLEVGASVE